MTEFIQVTTAIDTEEGSTKDCSNSGRAASSRCTCCRADHQYLLVAGQSRNCKRVDMCRVKHGKNCTKM